ncbi:MAG TPA: alpha/beta fold hydrolase [Candidatus Moranbacteria bacterium]|jgi:pimeloyl-ACP methyl ester carboxylesterase|nr:alpha/beta fold hydrolase [Candidatus Moranbacteria bacterium]HQB59531.1 alpha/beta fold hydrolase [Candidatus Moranbacteria bacterium]
MPKFETPSINKIFESRKKFISEIGEQLKKETKAELVVNGEKLSIDYRMISLESKEEADADVAVLLPGFGSGWEGIAELGFSLACEGRKVVMPSLPGYGNSDNPSEKYFQTDDFENEAEVLNQLLGRIAQDKKVHLIGHSMGSEIMASFAVKYPEKTSSIVLLNPAGVNEKENLAKLGGRFVSSGIKEAASFAISSAFSGEEDYEKELKKYIPKTKSPFAVDRISQRLSEAKKLSEGHLLEKIKNVECPITYISGEFDTVYPPGNENDENPQLARVIESVGDATKIEKSVMMGLVHNTTIAPDEITASNIEHYLEVAEQKNAIGDQEKGVDNL